MLNELFKDFVNEKIHYIQQKCKSDNYTINFAMDLSTQLSTSKILMS